MNLNEKKKKMQIIKIRNVLDSFLNFVYVHKQCAFLMFLILTSGILSYSFYAKSAKSDINDYLSNLFISAFTSLLTGFVLYVFVNVSVKRNKNMAELEYYIIKIGDKVCELLGIIELLINNNETNIYDKCHSRIGTWFVDFNSLKVSAYYGNETIDYKIFIDTINNRTNSLGKEYGKVCDDESLLHFCRNNRKYIIKWLDDIANYKISVQKKLDVINRSILINK